MSFLSAASLWWLLPILGAIIALYLLKMRRLDVRVPALFLWPQLTSDVRANAPIQRLRISLLFILQLIIAGLIITAFAGPLRRVHGLAGSATVVVLDNSASMQATDVSPTRFDSAAHRVSAIISSMSGSDRLAVIEAGAFTRIVFPLSTDKASMNRSLRQVQPSDAKCDMGEALRLASALVADRPKAKIIVLSDGNFSPVTDFSPGSAQLTYESYGTSQKNVGITAFDSALAPNGSLQCFASLHNYDSSPLPVTLTFKVDGAVADARQIEAPADSSIGQTFTAPATAHAAALAISTPGDILKADDQATIFFKGVGTIRTLLVSNGDLFLERALSLDPAILLERAGDVPDYERAGSSSDGRYDLVIFDNTMPRDVKAPAVWSLGQADPMFGVASTGISAHPTVLDWSRDDPVMQFADLRDVGIEKAQRVRILPGVGAKVLATGSDGPLIVSARPRGKRALYTGWSVLDSDFPLRISFPIFVANSVAWLTTGGQRAVGEQGGMMAHPGETFSVSTPGGSATLVAPDGSKTPLDGSSGAATIREADTVGIYHVQGPQVDTQVAVNMLDEDAGDVRTQPDLNLAGSTVAAAKTSGFMLSEFWRPIALAALLLMAAEWWVFVRRS